MVQVNKRKRNPQKTSEQVLDEWLRSEEREYKSDRGCVLLIVVALDNALESVLRAWFESCSRDDVQSHVALFEDGQPPLLQSTASKVKVAYAVGLLPPNIRNVILALNTIRSKRAAHSLEPFALTVVDADLIDAELNVPLPMRNSKTPRGRVFGVAAFLFGLLVAQANEIRNKRFVCPYHDVASS
jgi:hypothetical protein